MKIPSSFIEYHRTCRICKELVDPKHEVKYSVRHYAHPECFIRKFGAEIVTMLPMWKLELLPYKPLQDAGIMQVVLDHIAEIKKVRA